MLLDMLANNPQGLWSSSAYAHIEKLYSFPNEWKRDVVRERKGTRVRVEPQWQNEIRWARNTLHKDGLLDTHGPTGLWRLSYRGFEAARDPTTYELNRDELAVLGASRRENKRAGSKVNEQGDEDLAYGKHGTGGESLLHWQLKMYLAHDPTLVGYDAHVIAHTEHSFLTGDRVDVIYSVPSGGATVIEVEVEGEGELMVGLHQAIKYRTLAAAQAGLSLDDAKIAGVLAAYNTSYGNVQACARRYGIQLICVKRADVVRWVARSARNKPDCQPGLAQGPQAQHSIRLPPSAPHPQSLRRYAAAARRRVPGAPR
jgi:hypothetical protein